MKFGLRKPSFKKSLKARTTGKMKRKAKAAVNPFYGKKGTGYIRNPKKAAYNKVYNKTTVGVNPLSAGSNKKKNIPKRKASTPSDDEIYTKYETVEKEVAVTNPIEKFFRRLLNKDKIETKIVEETVIVEQYTYGEIKKVTNRGKENLSIYNNSIDIAQSTENPETFFNRLSQAEQAIEDLVEATDNYSFLEVKGDNVEESFEFFKKNNHLIIEDFADRYYSSCVESAEKLKTDRGKKNRYLRNYQDVTSYFQEIPASSVEYFNSLWRDKVPSEELQKES